MLRRLAAELRARTLGQIQKESRDALLLQGRIASWLVRSKETITSLRDVEFKVLSQFGEDGIIDWIYRTIADSRSFAQFHRVRGGIV